MNHNSKLNDQFDTKMFFLYAQEEDYAKLGYSYDENAVRGRCIPAEVFETEERFAFEEDEHYVVKLRVRGERRRRTRNKKASMRKFIRMMENVVPGRLEEPELVEVIKKIPHKKLKEYHEERTWWRGWWYHQRNAEYKQEDVRNKKKYVGLVEHIEAV